MTISALDAATPGGFVLLVEELCDSYKTIAIEDASRAVSLLRIALVDVAPELDDDQLRSARVALASTAPLFVDRALSDRRRGIAVSAVAAAVATGFAYLAGKVPELSAHPYLCALGMLFLGLVAIDGLLGAVRADAWSGKVATPMNELAKSLEQETMQRRGLRTAYRASDRPRVDTHVEETQNAPQPVDADRRKKG